MFTLPLVVFSAFLAFTRTSISSPLSSNVLTLPSFNQSYFSALNASTFNSSANSYYRWPVPGTPVTLDVFTHNEQAIPKIRLYSTLSSAALLIQEVVDKYPTREITYGRWAYEHRFDDGASCTFSVNDFREIGKPLIYSRLLDILRGLIGFSYDKDLYTTYDYFADINGISLTAAGRIAYVNASSTAANVDVT